LYLHMAAISLSPLPHTLSTMSGRRVPLSNNQNAANSPFRAVANAAAAAKQKRSYATIQREDSYGGQPPAKRQMLDAQLRTPPRQTQQSLEGRLFTRKSNAQPSAFERKCVAASQKPIQQTSTKVEKLDEKGLEKIAQWRKQQKQTFPNFVFYFESVSEDARLKLTKQLVNLGAVSS
jgi:regulatory subunit for Cdc7p protein kinase